jgi:peptidoglycan-N-acetylglucosamine deacetylase
MTPSESRGASPRRRPSPPPPSPRRRVAAVAACLNVAALGLLALALAACGSAHRVASTRATTASAPPAPAPATVAGGATSFQDSASMRRLIALGLPIYCAPPRGRDVALTFDDGPGPYTRLALAKLRKHHVRATFFIVGRNIGLVPGALVRERAIGAVGDHTFTHPVLTALTPGAAATEIGRTQAAVAAASGGPVVLFRPPYGARDSTIDGIVRAHGMLEILWTVDSADSLGANYAQIERNVIGGLRGGAIILMHENHGQTIRALLGIFAALKRLHLRPVSVPQLLTEDPPSDAQVRAGGAACGVAAGVSGH